jgi:hypothetical protein
LNQPFHRLPDQITVPLAELRDVIAKLENLLEYLRRTSRTGRNADTLDEVIGRMVRWIWPLLDELDQDHGYDE